MTVQVKMVIISPVSTAVCSSLRYGVRVIEILHYGNFEVRHKPVQVKEMFELWRCTTWEVSLYFIQIDSSNYSYIPRNEKEENNFYIHRSLAVFLN